MKSGVNFIKGDTRKGLIAMIVPLMLTLILNMAYSLVDSLWIGNMLGEQAMAALTSSTAVILLLTCVIVGSTNGIAILLSQALGAKDNEREARINATSFILSLFVISVLVISCEIFIHPILTMIGTPQETYGFAKSYLGVYLIGVFPSFFYMYFVTILRCHGHTMFQMVAILISTGLNIVLDPLFISMVGFDGAAIATIVTQTLSLIAAICYMLHLKCFQLHLKKCSVSAAVLILKKSVPAVIQQSIPAISTMALTTLVSSYGISAIAAFGIIGKMECILLYPVMAVNMGLTIIVGQCCGAGRKDRMCDYVRESIKCSGGFLLLLSALVVLFSKQLSWLFLQSDGVGSIVRMYFLIAGAGYVVHAVTTTFLAALNGMGKTTASMLLYIFYFLCIRVPLAILLSKSVGMELNGIWTAVMISHLVAVTSALFLYRKYKERMVVIRKQK